MRRLRYAILVVTLGFVLFAGATAPALGQSATPSPQTTVSPAATASPGPAVLGQGGWGKYMAVAMVGISALVVLALLAGLALQGPGFSKADAD